MPVVRAKVQAIADDAAVLLAAGPDGHPYVCLVTLPVLHDRGLPHRIKTEILTQLQQRGEGLWLIADQPVQGKLVSADPIVGGVPLAVSLRQQGVGMTGASAADYPLPWLAASITAPVAEVNILQSVKQFAGIYCGWGAIVALLLLLAVRRQHTLAQAQAQPSQHRDYVLVAADGREIARVGTERDVKILAEANPGSTWSMQVVEPPRGIMRRMRNGLGWLIGAYIPVDKEAIRPMPPLRPKGGK